MEQSYIVTDHISSEDAEHVQNTAPPPQRTHSYPTRNTVATSSDRRNAPERMRTSSATYDHDQSKPATPHTSCTPPLQSPPPKSVAFELLFTESPQYRARLPMRVQIFPHDTTDSIITTVKNFYGLYTGPTGAQGVSFEDEEGNILIARYENLRNNMVVYVRVIDEPASLSAVYDPSSYHSASTAISQGYGLGDGHRMPPPHPAQALSYGQPIPGQIPEASMNRSPSPNQGRGRRSHSAVSTASLLMPLKKSRSRSGFKSRGSSIHGSSADNNDLMNGYSSGDGATGSVSSKTKSDHLGNTEISLDNIVEGGRRKRAKFESSELPLFAPPQMPAANSNSSVSPARRLDQQPSPFPFTNPGFTNPFSNPHPLQSPQSFSGGFGQPGVYTTPAHGRRTRGAAYPQRLSNGSAPGTGSGILPTPDPTVGSCMSEEDKDVAIQLMRLGEMSNMSHGRASASTLDDTFSGRADATSSTGATSESDSDDNLPPARWQKREGSVGASTGRVDDNVPSEDITEFSCEEGDYEDRTAGVFDASHRKCVRNPKLKSPRSKSIHQNTDKLQNYSTISKSSKSSKSKNHRHFNVPKSKKSLSVPSSKGPLSPTSILSQSRKASVASTLYTQNDIGDDEEDLSSKPRCQRCRKSKKGCDRQRPCKRCKDAGLSADQCVSEDEGNGRKGRYGRHMGVPVRKDEVNSQTDFLTTGWTATEPSPEKNKKRKR